MDKVSTYLSAVSPLLIVAALMAGVLFVAVVPRSRRLHFAIGLLVVCTMVGQMPDLPGQGLAKISIAGSYLLVSFCALIHPGPRVRMPQVVVWWPATAIFACIFPLYVDNVILALALRFEWILLIVAAILVCRTITDREAAMAVVRAIGIGLLLGCMIAVTSIAVQGHKAFKLGRLDPYGANSNQIGVVIAAAVPFFLYMGLRARMMALRWGFIFMSAVAAAMVVITASRSSVVVAGLCVMPFIFSGMKRTAMGLSLMAVAAVVLIPFVYNPEVKPEQEDVETAGLSRLGSVDTPRYEIFARYLDESISKRPVFGLLGQTETSVLRDDDIGMHPHDAYLETMYLGGIVYLLPMLLIIFISAGSAIYVMRRRQQMGFDPLMLSMFGVMLISMYAHGFVNGSIFYPTSAWAFLHVFLSCFMIGTAWRHKRMLREQRDQARRGRRMALVAAAILLVGTTACCGGHDDKHPAQGNLQGGGQMKAGGSADGAPGKGAVDDGDDDGEGGGEGGGTREIDDVRHLSIDTSTAVPDVMCGVKLDKAEDGPEVRKEAKALKVPMLMMAYNWIVDVRKDGQFDQEDQQRFARWIDINIPPNSNQLVAIDYEKPYWKDLRNYRDLPPERLEQVMAVYKQIYDFAKAKRPKARWGFFGIPMRNYNAGEPWKQRIHELGPLLRHVDVIYLSIYDQRQGDRNGRDLEALRIYVELTLAEAQGRPVYAFARGRYAGRQLRDEPIPEDEFRAHIGAVLDAHRTVGGKEQKLAGVILWDGRRDKRATPASWSDLDKLYARQLRTITDVVRVKRPRPAGSK